MKINDFDAIHRYDCEAAIDMIIVGPEAPINDGNDVYFKDKNLNKIDNFPNELINKVFDMSNSEEMLLLEHEDKYFVIETNKSENIQKEITDPQVKKDVLLKLKHSAKRKLNADLITKINQNKLKKYDFDKIAKDNNISVKKINLDSIKQATNMMSQQ